MTHSSAVADSGVTPTENGVRVPRFIVRAPELPDAVADGHVFRLDADESAHLRGALRKGAGTAIDVVELLSARTFRCETIRVDADQVECRVCREIRTLDLPRATLLLGLPDTSVLESIVEKSVEIGVRRIVIFAAARSQNAAGRLDRLGTSPARLERIAVAALKQSGAPALPQIVVCRTLAEACANELSSMTPNALRLLCSTASSVDGSPADGVQPLLLTQFFMRKSEIPVPLQSDPQPVDSYVLIGPEGGLTDVEEAAAQQAGFVPVSLGPQVLRSETAAVAALSLIRMWMS